MTEAQNKYYPVTADELNKIKNDCIYPETDACPKGCEAGLDGDCAFSANILMDEVLSRSPVSSAKKSDAVLDELERRANHAKEGIHSKDSFKMEWEWREKAFREAIELIKKER